MAPDLVPQREDELPERFLTGAREAVFRGRLSARPHDIIQIASNAALRSRFLDLVDTQVIDPELRGILIEYLEEAAESLDIHVDTTDAIVELLDRAALPVASAAVVSGIGLMFSIGVLVGPITILCGGLLGLSVSGATRTMLKLRGNQSKTTAKKLRRLASQLRSL